MSYAGITKETITLGAAMMLAAQRAGCAEALLEELATSQAQVLASFRRSIPDMFGKAQRWAAELSEIAEFVGDGHVERASTRQLLHSVPSWERTTGVLAGNSGHWI